MVKVVRGGTVDCIVTWEIKCQMNESYPDLFVSGKFLRTKIQYVGEKYNTPKNYSNIIFTNILILVCFRIIIIIIIKELLLLLLLIILIN